MKSKEIEMYHFNYTDENFLIVVENIFNVKKLLNIKEMYERKNNEVKNIDQISLIKNSLGVAVDEVRKSKDYYRIWEDDKILEQEIFERYSYIMYPPMVRTVKDEKSFVDWHQDEAYMRMAKKQNKIITCFVSLEDNLINKPNIQFIDDIENKEIVHKNKNTIVNSIYIDELIKGKIINPSLTLGGCYIFGQKVVHRTHTNCKIFEKRSSLEFRITEKKSLIKDKDYYDLKQKKWVKI
jgi:hypothetical protein